MDKYPSVKYLVGIRHKESGFVRSMQVVDDPRCAINDIRAGIKEHPACAYSVYASDYEIVVKEISCDSFDSCVVLFD